MKILITTDTYENQICGVSSSIDTLKNELINRGHDVKVLLMSKNRKSKIIGNDYLIGSFSFHFIDMRQSLKFHDGIIDELVSWNPDIVHIQTECFASIIGKRIAKKCNCHYINTAHTSWEDFTMGLIPIKFIRNLISKKLVKSSYADSSAIIVPSEKMMGQLEKININLPFHLVPTGVDIDNFHLELSSIEKNNLKSQLDLDKDTKVLIYIGRIAKEKNLDELIDFLPNLISKNHNIKMVLVGDGPYLNHMKDKVKKLNLENHVRFTGVIPHEETYKYYHIADIFVSASTCETQGITYMEALASSLPLVCRYEEVLDNVIENGYNSFTYTDEEEYIKSIIEILEMDEEYAQLKNNAFKSSLKFSKEIFANNVEKVYLRYSK